MFGLGAPELLIVAVIVFVLFGSSKLPGFARSLGEAQREFHHGRSADQDQSSPRRDRALD